MRYFKQILIINITLSILILPALNPQLEACTSFQLNAEQGPIIAHSLNFGSVPNIPGAIFINQRDAYKRGYSWEALIQVYDDPAPSLLWKSKYGSVTFNTYGKELPDGGLNEAGLSIWEMGFDTQYPDETTKPKLFQCQWMQYVLDNFSTVDEVIENADRMAIDGWGWHYFTTDKSGNAAIIDFINGKPVVYSGSDLPLPLCCNSTYPEAMEWLSQHKGFGGELEIKQIFEEIPRFVYGAKLLKDYDRQNPVEYSFNILDGVSVNVRWAIVCDPINMTVYWKTNINGNVRHFELTPDDFSGNDPLMLDIECPINGNVKNEFVAYTEAANIASIRIDFGMLFEYFPDMKAAILGSQNADLNSFAERITERVRYSKRSEDYNIAGVWTGSYSVESSSALIEVPINLTINRHGDSYTGTIRDVVSGNELPVSNISYNGGLLYFTAWDPATEDLTQYRLYRTEGRLNGSIELWTNNRRAIVNLTR